MAIGLPINFDARQPRTDSGGETVTTTDFEKTVPTTTFREGGDKCPTETSVCGSRGNGLPVKHVSKTLRGDGGTTPIGGRLNERRPTSTELMTEVYLIEGTHTYCMREKDNRDSRLLYRGELMEIKQ